MEITVADSARSDLGLPSIAAAASCFLVAWKEGPNLLARRYSFDGSPLDVSPLALGSLLEPSAMPRASGPTANHSSSPPEV